MNKGSKCCRRYCKLEFKISTRLEQKKVWLRLTSYSLLESSFKCKWGQSWMTTPIKDLWKSLIFKRLSSSENFFEQHFFMLSPPKRRRFSRAENLHVTQKQQQQQQKKSSLNIKESNLEDGFIWNDACENILIWAYKEGSPPSCVNLEFLLPFPLTSKVPIPLEIRFL